MREFGRIKEYSEFNEKTTERDILEKTKEMNALLKRMEAEEDREKIYGIDQEQVRKDEKKEIVYSDPDDKLNQEYLRTVESLAKQKIINPDLYDEMLKIAINELKSKGLDINEYKMKLDVQNEVSKQLLLSKPPETLTDNLEYKKLADELTEELEKKYGGFDDKPIFSNLRQTQKTDTIPSEPTIYSNDIEPVLPTTNVQQNNEELEEEKLIASEFSEESIDIPNEQLESEVKLSRNMDREEKILNIIQYMYPDGVDYVPINDIKRRLETFSEEKLDEMISECEAEVQELNSNAKQR